MDSSKTVTGIVIQFHCIDSLLSAGKVTIGVNQGKDYER